MRSSTPVIEASEVALLLAVLDASADSDFLGEGRADSVTILRNA
jgi:hypothetical protein